MEEGGILKRVAAGDPTAVQQCIDTYGGLIWSLALRQLSRREDAEDIVQEVFVDLWKSAARFDPSKASEKGFICMIARRRLIDHGRREQRRPKTDVLPPASTLQDTRTDSPEVAAETALAARAIDQLKPKEREAVLLSAYHGMSHGQIAEYTGLPLGTVKTYVRRGLMRVKKMLVSDPPGQSAEGAGR